MASYPCPSHPLLTSLPCRPYHPSGAPRPLLLLLPRPYRPVLSPVPCPCPPLHHLLSYRHHLPPLTQPLPAAIALLLASPPLSHISRLDISFVRQAHLLPGLALPISNSSLRELC